MAALRVKEAWRAAGGAAFVLYLAAVVAGLVKVADQPSLDLGIGDTDVELVPTDVVFAALAVVVAVRLVRQPPRRGGLAIPVAAGLVAAWLLATAVPNGASAVVAAGRLLELGLLGLATVVLVERREQLSLLVGTLGAVTAVAVGVAFVGFLGDPGARQASFLGEHDLAALSSMVAGVGLAALAVRERPGRAAWAATLLGALGVTLGAALASLVGLYLAAAAVVLVAVVRGSVRRRALVATAVVLAFVTVGTLEIRSGDLGFLQVLTGNQEKRPGEFAASWSQRLIFAYVGLRVFEDNPVVGTGWFPLLPPEEFGRFVPDARARFETQPANYFPPADGQFIPQQTLDQVLYELGVVGAALFLALGAAVARGAARVAARWPREPDDVPAYVPTAWAASLLGVLAGAALFGGTPVAAVFWLTIGAVAAVVRLLPAEAAT